MQRLRALFTMIAALFTSQAIAQWEQAGPNSWMLVLHPDNDQVVVVDEGPDFVRYGIWYEIPGQPDEYLEFDVEKATWHRFDVNTTGATDSDEEAWGWSDNRVDMADVRLYLCLYQSGSLHADINTTGAGVNDPDWGKLDGVVDSSDLDYFVAWLTDFHNDGAAAVSLIADALANGDPCTNRAPREPQLAPREPTPKGTSSGETITQSSFPRIVGSWRYILVRDILKPQSSLDLVVNHWADDDEICSGEPGAVHFPEAYSETNFVVSFSATAGDITQVFSDREYEITEDCMQDGSNITVGNSSLRTMYRMKYRNGLALPINRWWAGLGVERNVLTMQLSGPGCGCP